MNLKSGSQRFEKCRWYQLVDEYMYDRDNVVSHAHANAFNPDIHVVTVTSEPNTTEHRNVECTSKSPESKRKEDMFLDRCFSKMEENNKSIIEYMKASDEMKMTLFMSMKATMKKLVDKLSVVILFITIYQECLATEAFVFAIQRLLAIAFFLAASSFADLPPVLIAISNSLAHSSLKYSNVSLELSSMLANVCKTLFATANLSCPDTLYAVPISNALCALFVAFCNHSFFQKLSPNMIQMLYKSKHMLTRSCTFFKVTSIIFKKMRHLPLSILKARSMHIHVGYQPTVLTLKFVLVLMVAL